MPLRTLCPPLSVPLHSRTDRIPSIFSIFLSIIPPAHMKGIDLLRQYRNGLDIYDHYLGVRLNMGQHINSPFRDGSDSKSFNLYINRTNQLVYFKDHVSDTFGNAIEFVIRLFETDYRHALDTIKGDLPAGMGGNHDGMAKYPASAKGDRRMAGGTVAGSTVAGISNAIITFLPRNLNTYDIAWWDRFLVCPQRLARYRMAAAEYADISTNGYSYRIRESASDPIYHIGFPSGRAKLYRPLSTDRKYKWRSNTNNDDIFGIDTLAASQPAIILTGGNKDVLSLSALLGGNMCIALPSESVMLAPHLHLVLESMAGRICLCYDADRQGREMTGRIAGQYPGIIDISAPVTATYAANGKGKDISEVVEMYRKNPVALSRLRSHFMDAAGIDSG